jgi:hypothetical protein
MMSGPQITNTCSDLSHMRSQITRGRNNKNTPYEFPINPIWVFMLFYRSKMNIREFIVIYVLN